MEHSRLYTLADRTKASWPRVILTGKEPSNYILYALKYFVGYCLSIES